MIKTKWLFCVLAVGGLLLAGCTTQTGNNTTADSENDKLSVVATNSIIANMVEVVGGDKVDVHSIVPVGTDPHEHEVLPEDIRKASNADVIFYNGINLETGNSWFANLMETTNRVADEDYFAVTKNVEPLFLSDEEVASKADPHAWLDISNGIKYVEEIERVLISKDPDNQTIFEENASAYIEKLSALHEEAKDWFSDVPADHRLLVTSEGAFRYFSKAYGLENAYIWPINTENEGTPEQMTRIIGIIRESDVPVLFVETSIDKRSMERVSKETELPIFGELFTDSIGKPGEEGDSYYAMMRWNLEKIHDGLLSVSE